MSSEPIYVGRAKDGSARLVPARQLAGRLHGFGWITPAQLKVAYEIPDEIWPKVQSDIAIVYREIVHPDPSDAELHRRVNQKLCRYALLFPSYGRPCELVKIIKILQATPVRLGEICAAMHDLAIRPKTRARMLAVIYMKIPLFSEFAHVTDASCFAYARGNFVAAFYAIIPVVEGILLR